MARVSSKSVGRWVPGIAMLARYEKSWLRSDLVAGRRAGRDPRAPGHGVRRAGRPAGGQRPLHDGRVPGRLRDLRARRASSCSGRTRRSAPLIFAAIIPLAVTDNPTERLAFAGFLALLVGAIEVGLGIGKLGFVADLLSKEVQVGYMMGLAVTIVVGQLPKLFGFSTDGDDFIDDVKAFVSGLDQTQSRHARSSVWLRSR